MSGFINVGGSKKIITKVFGNLDGKTVRAKSLWVDKNGVPVKIFSSGSSLTAVVLYSRKVDGTYVKRTKNMINFSSVTLPDVAGGRFSDVMYIEELGKFFTFNYYYSRLYLYTSTDGANWAKRQSSINYAIPLGQFSYANGVIFYGQLTGSKSTGVYSSDGGETWTATLIGTSEASILDVVYVGDKYYGISRKDTAGDVLYTNTGRTAYNTGISGQSLAYGNGILIAAGAKIMYGYATDDLTDSNNWKTSTLPEGNTGDSDNEVLFYNGYFYLFTSQDNKSCVLRTTDCVTWEYVGDTYWSEEIWTDGSKRILSLKSRKSPEGNSIFFASGMDASTSISDSPNTLFYSYDMLNWELVDPSAGVAISAESVFK